MLDRPPSLASPPPAASPRLFLVGALLAVACGGPIPGPETPAQATDVSRMSRGDAGTTTDAAATLAAPIHTMTITLCSRDPEACRRAQGGDTPGITYRVAFGGGTGTVRTREQALADLYRELRDRTALGTRLSATVNHLERPSSETAVVDQSSVARPTSAGHDPIVDAAFELLDGVDGDGQVALDTAHGRTTCKLSLAARAADAGGHRCLLEGPERPGKRDEDSPRDRSRRFGQ